MAESSRGGEKSELWIPLEEAVQRTGVSAKTIQEWARAGRIKRERRQGVTWLWMADLLALAPVQESGEAGSRPAPEVLVPEKAVDMYSGPALGLVRQLGEDLRQGQRRQEEIIERLGGLEKQLGHAAEGQLDARTAKDLALLGNVFRSIHQQNEKVGQALASQQQLLQDLLAVSGREEQLRAGLAASRRRSVVFGVVALLGMVAATAFAWYFLAERKAAGERVQGVERAGAEALVESGRRLETALVERDKREEALRQEHAHAIQELWKKAGEERAALAEAHKRDLEAELIRYREEAARQEAARQAEAKRLEEARQEEARRQEDARRKEQQDVEALRGKESEALRSGMMDLVRTYVQSLEQERERERLAAERRHAAAAQAAPAPVPPPAVVPGTAAGNVQSSTPPSASPSVKSGAKP